MAWTAWALANGVSSFQANEMQLNGPVPSKMYHRYVEFKPIIGSMFTSTGIGGRILNAALHRQHARVYNFDKSTEYGTFEPCSKEAALQFLRLAHFDQGGRIFTYVLTLDGLLRFTETGHEFGIDLLSKHTMHSDVQRYIAYSGEFFIRRLRHPHNADDPAPDEKTHPADLIPGGPPKHPPPLDPSLYQLVIDNDSGTYRPEKSILPLLKQFLRKNFPGLGIVAMNCADEHLVKLKEKQFKAKKKEGPIINMVMNSSLSSLSSAESSLDGRDEDAQRGQTSKREAILSALEDRSKVKAAMQRVVPGVGKMETGPSQTAQAAG